MTGRRASLSMALTSALLLFVSDARAQAPVAPEDRRALRAIAAELPSHGVLPPRAPKTTASDAAWQRFGGALARRLASPARRRGFQSSVRPLAPAVAALIPTHGRYEALRTTLKELVGRLKVSPPNLRKVRYKVAWRTTAPEVAVLRERLFLEGYGQPPGVVTRKTYFDNRLRHAMRAWQRDHGLGQTDYLDNLTRWRMNRHELLVGKVVVALERWRKHTYTGVGRHILVDITRGTLTAETDGEVELTFNGIAGRPTADDATPAMSSVIHTVTVNPAWRVPKRIVGELKRNVAGDADKLRSKGYTVRVDRGRWHVTKPPGPDNPLGKLIFRMPASRGVFLHDTNAKSLFERKRRTLSHGCVRLQQPVELARWMLPQSEHPLLDRLLASGQLRPIDVGEAVPTHLIYQTLEVASSGRLLALPDRYGRDPKAIGARVSEAVKLLALPSSPPSRPSAAAPEGSGYSLPATVVPLDGSPGWSLERFKGRLVVLTFMASWCDNCHLLAPKLKEVIDALRARGHDVALLGVGLDQAGAKAIDAYRAKHRLPFPVVMGGPELHRGATPLGRIERLPTTWIIGRTGVPLYSYEGRDSAKPLKGDLERYLLAETKLAKP